MHLLYVRVVMLYKPAEISCGLSEKQEIEKSKSRKWKVKIP